MRYILLFLTIVFLQANSVKCKLEENSIYCFYLMDRSDNSSQKEETFHWLSPSKLDDRTRDIVVPAYFGMVYDYRLLPGREIGVWRVEVFDKEQNRRFSTTFKIDKSNQVLIDD
jgi:hypothetical protein